VLRTFGRHGEAALLGKAFLVGIFGIFQPLNFHTNVLQQLWICAEFLHKNLFQLADAQTGNPAKAFPARYLVHQLKNRLAVTKTQVQSTHLLPGDLTALVALHDKGGASGEGDQVNTIGVAVEVFFQDRLGVKHAQVGTQPCGTLIFRSVHSHTLTSIRSCCD